MHRETLFIVLGAPVKVRIHVHVWWKGYYVKIEQFGEAIRIFQG